MFLKRVRRKDETTEIAATGGTSFILDGPKAYQINERAFANDDGNSYDMTIYSLYTAAGSTDWFEDYAAQIGVTAGELWTVAVRGGYVSKIMGLKETSAEDVVIDAFAEQWDNLYSVFELLEETTIEVDTDTDMYVSDGAEDRYCEAAMVLINDNANSNALTVTVYISFDKGTSWFIAYVNTDSANALDRKIAIPVDDLLACRLKVTGTKATSAENVKITVLGRRRNLNFRNIALED